MVLARGRLRQPVLDHASKQTPIRRECLVWLQFFDRINRGNGLARAWDGTDPRRRCGGVKTIDEIVHPNNRRGVDDHRRLCFSSVAKLDNLTVYSAGILPLFRGGRFCWLSAGRTFALFDLCSRSWLQAVSQSGRGGRSLATRSNAIHSIIVT